jgi:hypothetical protein
MKAKTIKAVLRKKIDDWLESIDDESVRELCKKNTIVTGGSIASMLLREKVNDYDIYFRNKETVLAVAKYYVGKFNKRSATTHGNGNRVPIFVEQDDDGRVRIVVKSAGIANEEGAVNYEYFESRPEDEAGKYVGSVMGLEEAQEIAADEYLEKAMGLEPVSETKESYRPVFLSSNAITLSDKIQLVIRFYGSPDEIHENYDFIHCTSYWTSNDSNLVLRPGALEALLTRELRYIGSKYPLASIIRTRKFINRGWSINAGQYLKMVMQLNELDLTDVEVLEDQLVGVDVAYFHQVISMLKEQGSTNIDQAYLMEIIDRMF